MYDIPVIHIEATIKDLINKNLHKKIPNDLDIYPLKLWVVYLDDFLYAEREELKTSLDYLEQIIGIHQLFFIFPLPHIEEENYNILFKVYKNKHDMAAKLIAKNFSTATFMGYKKVFRDLKIETKGQCIEFHKNDQKLALIENCIFPVLLTKEDIHLGKKNSGISLLKLHIISS